MGTLICVEVDVGRMTIAISNLDDIKLHKQIFVSVLCKTWIVWKIGLELVNAINLNVEVVKVIIANEPLRVQKHPLLGHTLIVLVHRDPCSGNCFFLW
jgi:hypothetical protein